MLIKAIDERGLDPYVERLNDPETNFQYSLVLREPFSRVAPIRYARVDGVMNLGFFDDGVFQIWDFEAWNPHSMFDIYKNLAEFYGVPVPDNENHLCEYTSESKHLTERLITIGVLGMFDVRIFNRSFEYGLEINHDDDIIVFSETTKMLTKLCKLFS